MMRELERMRERIIYCTDFDDIIEKLLHSREEVFGNAMDNIDDAQKKQKETYDLKHSPED